MQYHPFSVHSKLPNAPFWRTEQYRYCFSFWLEANAEMHCVLSCQSQQTARLTSQNQVKEAASTPHPPTTLCFESRRLNHALTAQEQWARATGLEARTKGLFLPPPPVLPSSPVPSVERNPHTDPARHKAKATGLFSAGQAKRSVQDVPRSVDGAQQQHAVAAVCSTLWSTVLYSAVHGAQQQHGAQPYCFTSGGAPSAWGFGIRVLLGTPPT